MDNPKNVFVLNSSNQKTTDTKIDAALGKQEKYGSHLGFLILMPKIKIILVLTVLVGKMIPSLKNMLMKSDDLRRRSKIYYLMDFSKNAENLL